MKFAVINGSPKGENSITLQTVKYLELVFPAHHFEYINAGTQINGLKKDFSSAKNIISEADALIFAYPVYTFLAPSQLHEFIHILLSCDICRGKFATQITTSKHFYDVTAHKYIEENCIDAGLKFIRGLSADMDDLTTENGRKQAREFFKYFLFCTENGLFEEEKNGKIRIPDEFPAENFHDTENKLPGETVIVTDAVPENINLNRMIECFKAVYPGKTRVVNLNDISIRGGCLGCLRCVCSGKCVYKDGFDDFLRKEIQSASATVYAFTVSEHSMGCLFKRFDDRQFCNGHRTVTAGKPVGYLVSGNISAEENLRMILNARAEAGGNFLCGIASDEHEPVKQTEKLSSRLAYAVENGYAQPANFFGVGGIKIFRDLIYMMRGMMRADHKFYKAHGMYDFPQKKKGTSAAMYLVGTMFSNEKILSKGQKYINEGMLMPYKKVLDEAEKDIGK